MATGNQNQTEITQNLRAQLALAVRSIHWSYAIFWSVSSAQSGMLEWCKGYYNGDIKTRKTVQAGEMNMDLLGLQRSDQLRELYESLSLGETEPQAKRPTDALSPEDLTDAEWYFLVCMSFVFNRGQGLLGRTLAKNQTIWLCGAHRADTKVFSRSLLAKSASIQTIVCFPHLGGVVELGTTELVPEDPNLIRHISSFLEGPSATVSKIPNYVFNSERLDCSNIPEEDLDHLLDDPFLEIDTPNSSSDEFADILLREESNFLEGIDGEGEASQMQSWPVIEDAVSNCLNSSTNSSDCVSQTEVEPEMMIPLLDGKKEAKSCMRGTQECSQKKASDLPRNDLNFHCVLSNILKSSNQLLLGPHVRNGSSRQSSFVCWRKDRIRVPQRGTPQKLLKKVLFEVARMHQTSKAESDKANGSSNQKVDEVDTNHVLSERKRREKINERFMILGSLIPSGGKVDKVSVLDHTIEYLRDLERRVAELESYREETERESTTSSKSQDVTERTSDNYGNDNAKKPATKKRKASRSRDPGTDDVAVSISETDVLIEINCSLKENVLLQVIQVLSKMSIETQTVQSSTAEGTLSITVNAKCKGLKSPSAVVIRQALQKVIRKCRKCSQKLYGDLEEAIKRVVRKTSLPD